MKYFVALKDEYHLHALKKTNTYRVLNLQVGTWSRACDSQPYSKAEAEQIMADHNWNPVLHNVCLVMVEEPKDQIKEYKPSKRAIKL